MNTDISSNYKKLLLEKRKSLEIISESFVFCENNIDEEFDIKEIVEKADIEFNKVKSIDEKLRVLEFSENRSLNEESRDIECEIAVLTEKAVNNIGTVITKISLGKNAIKSQLDFLAEAKSIKGYKPVYHARPIYFDRKS